MTSGNAGGSVRAEQSEASDPRLAAALAAVAVALLAFAWRAFLMPQTNIGLEKGVEYWFFRPNQTGPLVVLSLAAWLLYRRRHRLAALPAGPPAGRGTAFGVGSAFVGSLAAIAWAVYASAPYLMAFSVALAAIGAAVLYRGLAGLRVCWLPIALLLFSVPIPAPLMLAVLWKLQLLTADYSGWLLFVLGEPALVSGDQIVRASQTFQVIETCSGLRSIETLTLLTVTLIDLFGRRGAHAVLLVLSAPAIAFALNGVRVLTLILNPHSELLGVHTLQGVTILLAGLMLVYWLDGLVEKVLPAPPPRSRLERASRERPDAATDRPRAALERAGALFALGLAAVLVSETTPAWPEPPRERGKVQARIEAAAERWPGRDADKDWMFQGSVKFGDSLHREYRVQGEPVEVFVGLASMTRWGGSPLSPSTAFPSAGWHVVESASRTLPGSDSPFEARVLRKGNNQLLVHHWYAGARGLLRESLRSLLALDHTRFRRDEALYVVRLGTPLEFRTGEAPAETRRLAEQRLERVRSKLAPALAEL